MFTGIIEAVGEIAEVVRKDGDLRLRVAAAGLPMTEVKLGDSIATNGVCLTVVERLASGFWADVSRETLSHSTLAEVKPGDRVNLERAMAASSRFDGHIVSGHVDGIGTVTAMRRDARSLRLDIAAPAALMRYIAGKGSITVDGVSLTVNALEGTGFQLNIVPHTAAITAIAHYRVGSRVNLEVDIIARYLERLLQAGAEPGTEHGATVGQASGLNKATLAKHGFIKGGR